jgi:hypothetical protein
MCDKTNHSNINRSNHFAYAVKGAFVHELHANADIGLSQEGPETGNDVL